MKKDEKFIRIALSLARKGYKTISPNPPVGSLVVKDGKLISTGYHGEVGNQHAEVVALNKAGSNAQGSTLYVTLEPCNHFGKTPPCVNKILENRVARLVYGTSDPNELATGGALKLESEGVEVENLDSPLCKDFILPWYNYQSSEIKTLEMWAVASLNGFVLNDPLIQDVMFKNIIKSYSRYLERNVQLIADSGTSIDGSFYHFASYGLQTPLIKDKNFKIGLNLLRIPSFIAAGSDGWSDLVFPKALAFISARKFGNAILERYSTCN